MKKLNFAQIEKITKGAVYLEEVDGKVAFHRFTKEQEDLYKVMKPGMFPAALYTAGVKMMFRTNSSKLYLKVHVSTASADRRFFSVDVSVDGTMIGSIDNFSDKVLPENYTAEEYSLGEFEKHFEIGTGEKVVSIYLPYTMKTELIELRLDESADVQCVETEKRLLAFGDSITHGYDALHSSMRYASKLAEYLGAEEINKAIGGETFFPELAATKEEFIPEYVLVAYGTNDWSHTSRDVFVANCRAFYQNVSANYPKARIFAMSPIWRKDYQLQKEFGPFHEAEEEIRAAVEALENVEVISGFNLVPHDEKYFADLRLHPRDEGFVHYFENLKRYVH